MSGRRLADGSEISNGDNRVAYFDYNDLIEVDLLPDGRIENLIDIIRFAERLGVSLYDVVSLHSVNGVSLRTVPHMVELNNILDNFVENHLMYLTSRGYRFPPYGQRYSHMRESMKRAFKNKYGLRFLKHFCFELFGSIDNQGRDRGVRFDGEINRILVRGFVRPQDLFGYYESANYNNMEYLNNF